MSDVNIINGTQNSDIMRAVLDFLNHEPLRVICINISERGAFKIFECPAWFSNFDVL